MRAISIVLLLAFGGLTVVSGSSATAAKADPAGKYEYRVGDRLPQSPSSKKPQAVYQEIDWDTLVPTDWDPMRFFKGIDLAKLDDADPRAMAALEKLQKEWSQAPAKLSLNGMRVRIPGFVVPLENNERRIAEFLLVPYFGACIHVPPPPSNQIIHVISRTPMKNTQSMDAVWVSGIIEAMRSETGMGSAAYRMKAERITPYVVK